MEVKVYVLKLSTIIRICRMTSDREPCFVAGEPTNPGDAFPDALPFSTYSWPLP